MKIQVLTDDVRGGRRSDGGDDKGTEGEQNTHDAVGSGMHGCESSDV